MHQPQQETSGFTIDPTPSPERMAKLLDLRNAIASGTYAVPASAVAEKLLRAMLHAGSAS